jgi:membrane protein YqaA with SNARE-associated domain
MVNSSDVINWLKQNAGTIAVGTGGAIVGGAVGYAAGRKASKRNKNRKKSYSYKKTKRRTTKRQKKPYTAGKRKDTSKRRIRYTKNNQPYVILANGRARFISKKSVRMSRKRSGGRY